MDFKNITIFPELIEDAILYVLIAVGLCLVSKVIYDWKEKRRLARKFAEYQQKKEDEQSLS